MTELQGKCVAELRAEFEAATARLRQDLQAQLWNYYGAVRDPASASKERLDQLEDKLEDLTKAESYQLQADINWRLTELEIRLATGERQQQKTEATSKEFLQDLSTLKHHVANLEMTQSGAARHLQEVRQGQAELEKQHSELKQQAMEFKEGQSALKKDFMQSMDAQHALRELIGTAAKEAAKLKERMDEGKEVQKTLENKLEEQAASLKQEVASRTSGLQELHDLVGPMNAQLQALGSELKQLAALLQREAERLQDDREKAVEDLNRKLTQQEAQRAAAASAMDQKVSALTTQTEETIKTLKGNLLELTGQVTECQKGGKAAAENLERLAEKLKEESKFTKERFDTQQKKTAEGMEEVNKSIQQVNLQLTQQMAQVNSELAKCQKEAMTAADRFEKLDERFKEETVSTKERFEAENHKRVEQIEEMKRHVQLQFNSQLQQMQRDLKSFLHEQDTALQERVQQQLAELHETILQRTQTLINNRVERCQADITRMEKKAEHTDAELRSLKELHTNSQTEVLSAIQKNAADIQQVKSGKSGSGEKESTEKKSGLNGEFNRSTDQLYADLKAVREGIDSIKNSVGVGHPWMMPPASPVWQSRPCSPVRTGPLLRPCAGVSNLRTSSVSPPWVRPPVTVVPTVSTPVKAPPPIPWVPTVSNCPEPVAPTSAPGSHVPPVLQAQSGTSSESSEGPSVLKISCPATPGLPTISGEYYLVSGVCPNGRPLWKHRQQELWLYCGTNHRWFVGGPDAKDWKFKCEAGFIYSDPVVAGSSPDQASGWARFQGGLFVADSNVTVRAES